MSEKGNQADLDPRDSRRRKGSYGMKVLEK